MARRRDVSLRPSAIRDLIGLADYIIDNHGLPRTADAYMDRIESRCFELGDLPFVGRQRNDLGAGVRTLPFESVLIIYRVHPDRVVVERVVGQRQHIDRTLLKR